MSTTPDDLLAEAERRAREQEEAIRLLRLALTEETARTASLRASMGAVREALGDAAGQTGTLAEDVAATVSHLSAAESLIRELMPPQEDAAMLPGVKSGMFTAEARARIAAHTALLDWLALATGTRDGHDGRLVEAMALLERQESATALVNVVESVRGLPGVFRARAEEDMAASRRNKGVDASMLLRSSDVLQDCAADTEQALLAGRKEG